MLSTFKLLLVSFNYLIQIKNHKLCVLVLRICNFVDTVTQGIKDFEGVFTSWCKRFSNGSVPHGVEDFRMATVPHDVEMFSEMYLMV